MHLCTVKSSLNWDSFASRVLLHDGVPFVAFSAWLVSPSRVLLRLCMGLAIGRAISIRKGGFGHPRVHWGVPHRVYAVVR